MSAEESNAESKYEVREVIGKGAFGEVNLVVEKQSKQRFVLKRIKMARQSEWQRKATRQEIEIVSRLRHPFIMPYKEHWTHHGHTINVVYGYCEKGDLTSAITKQKGKFFSEETLRLWLAQLLLAVDYMHRQNVLHRDIKTQNILLTGDGDVQIGDFGLSTVRVPSIGDIGQQQQPGGDDTDPRMDSSPAHFDVGSGGGTAAAAATPEPAKGGGGGHHHHVTATAHVHANPAGAEAYTNGLANAHANGHNGHHGPGDKDRDQLAGHTPVHDPKAGTRNDYALVGTPHFMSPELLSSQKYSYETDIWSLGVVMYELTTLKPPFNAFNLAGLVAKIKRAALPPISPSYSADWTAILKSMLRKDPTRRAAPLELLAIPSMQQALQQARQRALAISPDFVMPEMPVLDAGLNSSGFCFDVAPAPSAVPGGGGGAVQQRTPSAAGPSTPVLINPLAAGGDDGGGDGEDGSGGADAESSPLSKFPDLGPATESPLPAAPVPAAGAAAPSAAVTLADTNRSKTPATARRPGGAAGPVPGTAAGAAAANATAAAAAKRAVSPQRTRAPPVFGGPQRSRTPSRTAAATTATAKADAARKPATARERSRSVMNTAVATSPRNLSGGGAASAAEIVAPATARAASPTDAAERQQARKAGPSSGPAPRVAAIGAFRAGPGRRSLLDAVGGQQQQQQGPAATLSGPAAHDVDASDAASPGSLDATAGKATSSPPSTGGHKSSSPATAATAGGSGGGGAASRPAPWRARSVSVNTVRTSRTSLAAGSPPSQVSPRAGDAAAGGHHHHQAVSARRHVSVARGGSTDPTSGASAAAAGATATAVPRFGGPMTAAGADGTKRAGAAAEAGSALASARARNTSSPPNRANAAPAHANTATAAAAAAAARRRSQPGTAAVGKGAAAADAAAAPPQRVRRSSFVSYGKAAESAPLQRRPPSATAAQAHGSVHSSRDSAPASTVAGAARATAAKGPLAGPLSSHPLAASDVALDSCTASASGSPVGQHPGHPPNGLEAPVAGAAVPSVPSAGSPEELLLSSTISNAAAAGAVASGGLEGEPSEAAAAAGAGGHPWRQTPRSRSLRSMATEDSELSIPDGRYGPSETIGGAVYDGEMGATAAAFAIAASPGRVSASSIAANSMGQPLWSCNQLYSGSYGSCAGSLNDMGAQAASMAPSGAAGAAAPQGGAAAAGGGGSGSARGAEAALGTAAAGPLSVDLPRRVSASAFAPHLLGSYGSAATTALAAAAAGDDVGGTDSEASTPVEAPRGSVRGSLGLRRLTLNESVEAAAAGGGPMQLVSPGRFDLVSSSPAAAGVAADSLSPLSSTAASPQSGMYGVGRGGGGMEIVSPTPANVPSLRRHGSGGVNSGFNTQQQQRRSGGIGGHSSSHLSNRYSAEYDASPLGSTVNAVQRALAAQQQVSADEATASAGPAPADSCSEVTSQLRPVAEEGDGEAESRGGAAAAAAPSTARDLGASERAQLALLQRVVALAGSLWEMGRQEELGAVLSSTLSRPLVRCRPGAAAAAASSASGLTEARSGASEQHPSRSLSPSGSLQQRRAPEPGDVVRVTVGTLRGSEAVVRYRGPCHWGAGTVLGLELPQATAAGPGGTDESPGCRDGVRYFRCHRSRAGAAFLGVDQVTLVD